MATYYVTKHASASDSNGGTNATTDAWATVEHGFSSISGGDTLKIGTGTYDIDRPSIPTDIANGSSGNPTIITDNGDGTVTLQHPGTANRFGLINFSTGNAKSYISFIGTSQGSLVFDGENQSNCATLFYLAQGTTQNNHHIVIQKCELKRAKNSAILGGHSSDVTIDQNIIHDSGSNSSSGVPQDHGVYASGPNLVLTGNTVYNIWGHGFQTFSSSASAYSGRVIRGNIIYNTGYGAGSEVASAIIFEEGGGIIENNLIYGTHGTGIECWRGTGVTIYHNTVHGCSLYGIQVGFSGTNAFDCLVKNNTAVANTLGDMRVTTATRTVISWNVFGSSSIINSGTNTTSSNNTFNAVAGDEFVDIASAEGSRDYNLKAGADSIWDASTNNVPSVGVATDIEGTERVHPDQGAYAFGTPDPPEPPVIGHSTNYPVTAGVEKAIAITISDADSNTLTFTIVATGKTALRLGTTTNCTVDVVS